MLALTGSSNTPGRLQEEINLGERRLAHNCRFVMAHEVWTEFSYVDHYHPIVNIRFIFQVSVIRTSTAIDCPFLTPLLPLMDPHLQRILHQADRTSDGTPRISSGLSINSALSTQPD